MYLHKTVHIYIFIRCLTGNLWYTVTNIYQSFVIATLQRSFDIVRFTIATASFLAFWRRCEIWKPWDYNFSCRALEDHSWTDTGSIEPWLEIKLPVGIGSTALLIAWMICCKSTLNSTRFFFESSPFLMMINVPSEFMFSQVHGKLFITFTDRTLFEVTKIL